MPSTSTLPPTADGLRTAQIRLGLADAALWLLALPLGADLFALAGAGAHYQYRGAAADAGDYESAAELAADLVVRAHMPDDVYHDVDTVDAPWQLLRVVADGTFKHVTGMRTLLGVPGPLTGAPDIADADLVAVARAYADAGGGPFAGVLTAGGTAWLLSARGAGSLIHSCGTSPDADPEEAFGVWARRVCAAVGAVAVDQEPARRELRALAGGGLLAFRAAAAAGGSLYTQIPGGWTFAPFRGDAAVPRGWHVMGVRPGSGQAVVQHGATGMCAVLLDG